MKNISGLTSDLLQEEVVSHVNASIATSLTNSSLQILNHLIFPNYIWGNLSESIKFNSSTLIFKTVGDLSILMNLKQQNVSQQQMFKYETIEMHSKLFAIQSNESIHFEFDAIVVQLPFEALNSSDLFDEDFIASTATVLKRFPEFLSLDKLIVNSGVISIKVGSQPDSILLNNSHNLQFM